MPNETIDKLVEEFEKWHAGASKVGWRDKNARMKDGDWYWKGHHMPTLYAKLKKKA